MNVVLISPVCKEVSTSGIESGMGVTPTVSSRALLMGSPSGAQALLCFSSARVEIEVVDMV